MNAAPLQPVLSRRAFIFGISALAGGLVLGTPAAFAQAAAQAPTPTLSAIDIRSVCECAGDAHCVIVAASAVTIRSIFMSRSRSSGFRGSERSACSSTSSVIDMGLR